MKRISVLLVMLLASWSGLCAAGSFHARALRVRIWQGEVTVTVQGTPVTGEGGNRWEHRLLRTARWYGTFIPDTGLTVNGWKLGFGRVVGRIDAETFQVESDSRVRTTLIGNEKIDVAKLLQNPALPNSVIFALGSGGTGWELHVPVLMIRAFSTTYEPNKPQTVMEGPNANQHEIPGARFQGLPFPAAGAVLSGTRTCRGMVFGATGDGTMMEVTVTWKIEPQDKLAPLKPLGPGK